MYQTPPASSILSTAADMGHFLVAQLQNGRYGSARILSDSAAALMHRQYATMHPRLPGWTLGFQVNDLNGRYLIEHGGDVGGFSSLLTLLPEEGVGFFVVHHLEGSNLRFDLRQAILDRYFPRLRAAEYLVPTRRPRRSSGDSPAPTGPASTVTLVATAGRTFRTSGSPPTETARSPCGTSAGSSAVRSTSSAPTVPNTSASGRTGVGACAGSREGRGRPWSHSG